MNNQKHAPTNFDVVAFISKNKQWANNMCIYYIVNYLEDLEVVLTNMIGSQPR